MKPTKNLGFGLIEILISIFIVAFGVLAVGKLQTELISSSAENKASAEALVIAQGHMEDLRNYFAEVDSTNSRLDDDTFLTNYLVDLNETPPNNGDPIIGVNAIFTLSHSINVDDNVGEINVSVSWIDSTGDSSAVNITSSIIFSDAASFATSSFEREFDTIEAPTGRAKVGEGEITSKNLGTDDMWGAANKDGTQVYRDNGDDDKNLLLAVGDDVVLTLEEACVTPNEKDTVDPDTDDCVDFVKISGKVYIEPGYEVSAQGVTHSINSSTNPIYANDIFVLASDAAYCSRYTTLENGNVQPILSASQDGYSAVLVSGLQVQKFDPDGDSDASKDYYFFEYTCYLGGGWNGNIGLLSTIFSDGETPVEACVGDPSSNSIISGDTVESSRRRAYRGMVWKFTGSSIEPIRTDSTDNGSPIIYYSWGIADATLIDGDTGYQHDFLLVDDPDDCSDVAIMSEAVFTNNIDDFYCLNEIAKNATGLIYHEDVIDTYVTETGFDFIAYSTSRTNLDERDLDRDRDGYYENEGSVGYYDYCPYDPTNPPYFFHAGLGEITISLISVEDYSTFLDEHLIIKTSQEDNCSLGNGFARNIDLTSYTASYDCTLYDSGKTQGAKLVEAGVSGVVGLLNLDGDETVTLNCDKEYFAFNDSVGWSASAETSFECTANVNVIGNENSVPDAVDDTFTVTRGETIQISIEQLLGNDNAGDGATTFVSINDAGSGRLTEIDDNTFSYTYGDNFAGSSLTDTYSYTIRDADGDLDTALIIITVTKN